MEKEVGDLNLEARVYDPNFFVFAQEDLFEIKKFKVYVR